LFEAKDILQTNVAMIVGILIFYTIQFLIPANGDVRQRLHAKIVVFCISIAIGFFFAIYKTDDNSSSRSLGFIVLFVMDRDTSQQDLGHGRPRLDLFAYLVGKKDRTSCCHGRSIHKLLSTRNNRSFARNHISNRRKASK
jgi:hypothetical protein